MALGRIEMISQEPGRTMIQESSPLRRELEINELSIATLLRLSFTASSPALVFVQMELSLDQQGRVGPVGRKIHIWA